jgi:hypothetical protein
VEDTRILSALVLTLNGEEPHALGGYPLGPGAARFSSCANVGTAPDPTLLIERRRSITDVWQEQIRVTDHRVDPVEVRVGLQAAADLAYIFDVKHGRHPSASTGRLVDGGARFDSHDAAESAVLGIVPMPDGDIDGSLRRDLLLPAQGSWEAELTLRTGSPSTDEVLLAAAARPRVTAPGVGSLARPRIACSDGRFEQLIGRSIDDLDSLLVREGENRNFAAGTPWFLTLFGRVSLWSDDGVAPRGRGRGRDAAVAGSQPGGPPVPSVAGEVPPPPGAYPPRPSASSPARAGGQRPP